ncbi:hypothetical protein Tco_1275143 [Tanacetum coccineum]
MWVVMDGMDELLVPSCFAIFDLDPLSLFFEFVFTSEIFKSLSFCLDRLYHLAILCLDQHAHTLHHLESLLTISLDRLDILKEDLFEHEHVVMNPTSAGMRHLHLHLYMNPEIKQLAIKCVDEYGFVIRSDLVRLTSGSVGPFHNMNIVPMISSDKVKFNYTIFNLFLDEMISSMDVLGTGVLHGVARDCYESD